jgi:hypothetical protein
MESIESRWTRAYCLVRTKQSITSASAITCFSVGGIDCLYFVICDLTTVNQAQRECARRRFATSRSFSKGMSVAFWILGLLNSAFAASAEEVYASLAKMPKEQRQKTILIDAPFRRR